MTSLPSQPSPDLVLDLGNSLLVFRRDVGDGFHHRHRLLHVERGRAHGGDTARLLAARDLLEHGERLRLRMRERLATHLATAGANVG